MPASHFFAKSPEEVGLDSQKVQALFERAEREVKEGILPACQVAIARNGKIAHLRAHGGVPIAAGENLHTLAEFTALITAHGGDAVSLRACSDECGSEHDVTVTTTITWKGSRLATASKSGRTREGHCQPSSTASATLP
jgi:hypothetical protein